MLPGAPSRLPSSFPLRRALAYAHPGEPLGAWVRMGRWPLHLRAGGCALLASADLGFLLSARLRCWSGAASGLRCFPPNGSSPGEPCRSWWAPPTCPSCRSAGALPRPPSGPWTHRPAAWPRRRGGGARRMCPGRDGGFRILDRLRGRGLWLTPARRRP
jgi:hypothetical protein